ncbi:kinase-like protein [Rhizophagus irregularis]|nr:kinase-like protein [Rhizophagus irregularis]
MSLFKSLKLVFKRKKGKSTEAKSLITECNDLLRNFITEKEIRFYEYLNFKELTRKGYSVRAIFDDEYFIWRFFDDDDETIRKVIHELELLHNISHKNILKFCGVSRIEVDDFHYNFECWNYDSQKRPNIQQVVSTLNQLRSSNNFQDNNPSDNATEWIKNALNNKVVNFIPFSELTKSEFFKKGGFGHIMKAIWTKTGNYVVYKKLTNTDAVRNDILDAFIHELKIHLHFDYCDRIVRCFGISQDVTTKEYLLVMQFANGGDLRNYFKDNFKKLTWEDKKRLAFQIADGLNYLHNENVLHRDLVALICAGKREIPIPETPKEYEELYIKCWDQEPKQRPTISEVLKEFEKMGFGVNVKNKIIEDNSQALGSTSSLYIS